MAWTLKGTWYESCSCKLFCPCNLGPATPDQGWCSGLLGFAVDSGSSNGVDLGGVGIGTTATTTSTPIRKTIRTRRS